MRLASGASLDFVRGHELSQAAGMFVDEFGRVYDPAINNAPEVFIA